MRSRTGRLAIITALALALTAIFATGALASFHLMKIRSVFRGPVATGAFVELQMTADGQNLVGGHQLKVYNPTATTFSAFTIPSNVANGQSQRMILLGDTTAPGSPDFILPGLGTSLTNLAGGGALCFDVVDCISWGTFTGEANLPSPAGTPINGGLSGNMVSVRTITRGCVTALDEPDDTQNTTADFTFAVGYPMRNNAATPTEVLCKDPTATPAKKKCKKKKRKKKRSASSAAKKKKKKRCGKKKKKKRK